MVFIDIFAQKHRVFTALAISIASLYGCASGGGGGSDSDTPEREPTSQASATSEFSFGNLAYCGTPEMSERDLNDLNIMFAAFNSNGGSLAGAAPAQGQNATEPELLDLSDLEDAIEELDDSLQSLSEQFSRTVATIPVVFHVISKGQSLEDGEVPDSMLVEQINVLNQGFNGAIGGVVTPFQFQLQSINRVRRPEWHVMPPGSEAEKNAKKELKVGGPETLNVYVTDIGGPVAKGNILAYATFPLFYDLVAYQDGVVMNFRTLPGGPFEKNSLGRVLIHEVGHWLGLLHTFQNGCFILNDLVIDTPQEDISIAQEGPDASNPCPVNRDTCSSDLGTDPVHNHMTYTADSCRQEFTGGQLSLMRFNAIAFRRLPI